MSKIAGFMVAAALSSAVLGGAVLASAAPATHCGHGNLSVVVADGGTTPTGPAATPTPSPTPTSTNGTDGRTWGWG